MDNLLPIDDPKVKELNKKIKRCLDEQTITFTLNEEGRLVAMGHFGGGDDTIGHDDYSICDWNTFIKHS